MKNVCYRQSEYQSIRQTSSVSVGLIKCNK